MVRINCPCEDRNAYFDAVAEDKVTASGRELGAELRRRRELAGYNGLEMSKRLGWSQTQISRVETGARPITPADVAIYLSSCGVPRDEMDPILELARDARRDHRFKSHGEQLPDELTTLIFHETTAASIEGFELTVVPGLLQTEDYIRALLRHGTYAGDSMEFRVQARIDRQRLLRRSEPPWCTFFIHENGLRMQVGDSRVMHDQLLQLTFLAGWQRCRIRVVPGAAGPSGLANSSFRLLSYAEHEPVVYVEQESASVFLDKPEHAAHFRQVLNRLDRVALDEGQSRQFLADLAGEFERAEDGPDV
jgi:transcriptional regulator with XRE-family HTH domain